MMSIKEDPRNNTVFIKLGKMPNTMRYYIRQSLFEIGRSNVKAIRKSFILPKTGFQYRNLPNRSSAPGESPAKQSGDLSRSVDYQVRGASQLEVGDTSQPGKPPYGFILERIMNRPHVSAAVKSEYKNTQSSLIKYVKRGMSK